MEKSWKGKGKIKEESFEFVMSVIKFCLLNLCTRSLFVKLLVLVARVAFDYKN